MTIKRDLTQVTEFDNVTAKHETDLALLVDIDGEEHWVPKSQIHDDSEIYEKGHTGQLITTRWWAKKVGLVDD